MPKVRYLHIQFNQSVLPREIQCFRAAVIDKTERVASHFHNHVTDTTVIYRYPLIQYKLTQQKASIVCLEKGTDDIHYLIQHQDLDLRIGQSTKQFEVEAVDLRYHQTELTNRTYTYQLKNWLPLNQKNYAIWQSLEHDPFRQGRMLNKVLCGNILSFAKGINWHVDGRILSSIQKVDDQKPITYKGVELLSFDIRFECNVCLPNYVGLGKGVSVGFGVVTSNQKN